jgi:hypothetical protein
LTNKQTNFFLQASVVAPVVVVADVVVAANVVDAVVVVVFNFFVSFFVIAVN